MDIVGIQQNLMEILLIMEWDMEVNSILMIPSKDLVIVTTHNHDTPNGIQQQIEFLNKKTTFANQ